MEISVLFTRSGLLDLPTLTPGCQNNQNTQDSRDLAAPRRTVQLKTNFLNLFNCSLVVG